MTVEEQEASIVLRDYNWQQLAYVYFEDKPGAAFGHGRPSANAALT